MFYQAFQRGLGNLRSVLVGMADLYENNLFLSYLYQFLDFEPRVKRAGRSRADTRKGE